jgi:hypothetical protein
MVVLVIPQQATLAVVVVALVQQDMQAIMAHFQAKAEQEQHQVFQAHQLTMPVAAEAGQEIIPLPQVA